ncbi:Peptidyl-prolyl cis-trans isomerase FKBP19, chloroplastic [Glycine soja]|uniref:peptidylprolyl isomerase n=1 Tax=Glycine soja TaxID=3848 RepID=A0A445LLJ3_GLYSO|nr:Peptidyl-prolyl cis-trans isomerase FKBP19, chloroplastic [Glycine soja]
MIFISPLQDPKNISDSSSSASGRTASCCCAPLFQRRKMLFSSIGIFAGTLCNIPLTGISLAAEFADMPALRGKDYGKTKMRYPDYAETKSGLQYKDLRPGNGPKPKMGETVVVDWDGYTRGYYGRIFEAQNKTKGGSFEGDDKNFVKFKIGYNEIWHAFSARPQGVLCPLTVGLNPAWALSSLVHKMLHVIPAFEEVVSGLALGGIRRIIVPPELGYPENDFNKSDPRPTTFSGQRALDFVLRNQDLIDKTLLFDIEL